MSKSVLSDFWGKQHIGIPARKELFHEVHELSKQSWESFTPENLICILVVFGNYLNSHPKDSREYLEAKKRWRSIQSKCLSSIRTKANLFNANYIPKCLNGLADIDINITESNHDLIKSTLNAVMENASGRMSYFAASNLHDFAIATLKIGMHLTYTGEYPTEELQYRFFEQTAKIMSIRNYGFSEKHLIPISKMAEEMSILPDEEFMSAARGWHSSQPSSSALDKAMKEFEKLAFKAYVRRSNPASLYL